ncbi:MAG: ribonuclease HII [Firmicutes bacterium]|uniref:Ribonuclease HII n=1 Tax=Melghirimyces thermohalophilus TaxID=1236220 RepID=A0A1G6NLN8_9BACL|nr:ribonuclease HII [Melghirimyces thermohalophilus]MDA8352292.1 ribonuclease HII [Bacillota bacterium]SDC68186.1 RNase HII [Melghirimyces thermohalophilus]
MKVKGTIREIADRLSREKNISESDLNALLSDPRAGVQKLARSYLKKREAERREQKRIEEMWQFERTYRERGYRLIAGVDEAGRGPLAGPVVAAAVILPDGFDARGLNDSKKLTRDERLSLRSRIEAEATAIGVGVVDHGYIDQHNILQATYEAVRRAVAQLDPKPDCLLLDALRVPGITLEQQDIVKGDALSHSIAAASIIAKTVRDDWMMEAGKRYPQYGFESHVGYSTPDHLAALDRWGVSPIHRKSFAPVKERAKKEWSR